MKEKETRKKENIIKLKENYVLKHKEGDRKKKVRILSREGKARSKKWGRSYNVEDVDTGEVYWLNLDEWEVKKEEENEEGLWVKREDSEEWSKMRAKEDELRSWKENKVYREFERKGEQRLSTRWIVTKKIKNGEERWKARLVVLRFPRVQEKD